MPNFLNNPNYTVEQITNLSQNTFIYFFRNHPNFTSLARQVLAGYDRGCETLSGYPHSSDGLEFDFTYSLEITSILKFRSNLLDIVASNAASSDNTGPQPRNDASNSEAGPSNLEAREEHVSQAISKSRHVYYILFTFTSIFKYPFFFTFTYILDTGFLHTHMPCTDVKK